MVQDKAYGLTLMDAGCKEFLRRVYDVTKLASELDLTQTRVVSGVELYFIY